MGEATGTMKKLNDIRRKIGTSELTADKAQKLIQDEIERELSRPAEDIDMAFVDACETFLTSLDSGKADSHYADNLRAVRGQMRKKTEKRRLPRIGKAAATACAMAAMLAVVAFIPGGVVDVLGLAGNDHTRRLEEMQDNPQNNAIGETPEGAAREVIPLEKGTLTLSQAEEKDITTEDGRLRVLAQTYADVDDVGGIYMMLALIENTTESELTASGMYFVGFDAEGNQMKTAYDVRGNAVIPAGEKALLSVEIEKGAMDGAERFEMWLDVCETGSAEKQEASADLRDHYFVAALTENDTDGEEANGYLSAWAFDAQGMLLDGFSASLEEGEQILAGESWIFEKRIGSWVTLEQEEDARVEAAGYRLLTAGR